MNIPILGDVIREVGATVREFIPDADKRMEVEFKLAELADKADARENELLIGQVEINKEEAKSANLFVSGWRPAIGWTGAGALAWTWILAPLLNWGVALFGVHVGAPALPAEAIYPIILAMLGIGGMRTFEKTRGVATSLNGRVLQPVKAAEAATVTVAERASETVVARASRWIKSR